MPRGKPIPRESVLAKIKITEYKLRQWIKAGLRVPLRGDFRMGHVHRIIRYKSFRDWDKDVKEARKRFVKPRRNDNAKTASVEA